MKSKFRAHTFVHDKLLYTYMRKYSTAAESETLNQHHKFYASSERQNVLRMF